MKPGLCQQTSSHPANMTEKITRVTSCQSLSSTETAEELQVTLKDCEDLIRNRVVGLPGGFTRSGHPLIIFPDNYRWCEVLETELHLLLKYYCHIIPRTDQISGFAILIDRRNGTWQDLSSVFYKIVSQFPGDIKEVFLLYKYPSGKPMLGQLVDSDYLLDFDIFHVSAVTELLHYVDGKYLGADLDTTCSSIVDTWIQTQHHVDSFTLSATQIAKRLAEFISILNKEDVSRLTCQEKIIEVADKNRKSYRKLRQELEDLTEAGVIMLHKFEEDKGTMMQKLSVQMLCYQLDTTWQFFTRTFKMQDHLYVQYVEITVFQAEFHQVSNKFKDNESLIHSICESGSHLDDVNTELDKLESMMEGIAVDVYRAKKLAKAGQELISEYNFTKEILEPKCVELRSLCKKQELMFTQRRQTLLKFLCLFQSLDSIKRITTAANQHLAQYNAITEDDESISVKELRQLEFLLKKVDELKVKSIFEFDEEFDSIRELISPKTLFAVDDTLNSLQEVKKKLMQRLDFLLNKGNQVAEGQEQLNARKENILEELLTTEARYVQDLEAVIKGYKNTLEKTFIGYKADDIFGNLEELHALHSGSLLPQMCESGANMQSLAKTFTDHCPDICKLYRRYCQNIENARETISQVGENHPAIIKCQRALGHTLPLSSYLLKPVQRLTKYQLMLKDLLETCQSHRSGRFELQECLAAVLRVIRSVNDSLHRVNITNLPTLLDPLGSLVCQETFTVLTENKSQSQVLFRNRAQTRHVLLYENYLIFCRVTVDHTMSMTNYQYKFSLPINIISLHSSPNDEKKLELWTATANNQSDVYILEARNAKCKEDFIYELQKLVKTVNDSEACGLNSRHRNSPTLFSSSATMASSSSGDLTSTRKKKLRFSRSKSLDTRTSKAQTRSRSLDSEAPEDGGDEAEDEAEDRQPQYKVLGDYEPEAGAGRELSLTEGEVVRLVKIGCAGWWYVKCGDREGWAPSTYLQILPGNTKTLDRRN